MSRSSWNFGTSSREVGFSANRRLLGVRRLSHNPIRAADACTAVHEPTTTSTAAGCRATPRWPPRPHPVAGLVFRLLIPTGFGNRDLRELLAGLLGKTPGQIRTGQVSYDLRRLRAHGLITRIPGTHRYQLTETAGDHAMLLTHLHTRLLQPGLAQLTDPNPPTPSALRTAANAYRRALDKLTADSGLAAWNMTRSCRLRRT
jgi:hypothetical protein